MSRQEALIHLSQQAAVSCAFPHPLASSCPLSPYHVTQLEHKLSLILASLLAEPKGAEAAGNLDRRLIQFCLLDSTSVNQV
jgi:hypothetical protein